MNTAAPEVAGVQKVPRRTAPTNLVEALNRQVDLSLVLQTRWVEVFANSMFHGVVAQSTPSGGLTPVLGEPGTTGALTPGGDVVAGLAPASAFRLEVNGQPAPRAPSTSWAGVYQVTAATAQPTGEVVVDRFPWNGVLAALTLLAWLYAATGFGGRRIDQLVHAPGGRHVRRDDA